MKRMTARIYVPNCIHALKYYQEIFGGNIERVIPQSDHLHKIAHAELKINPDISLFLHDTEEGAPYSQAVTFILEADDQEELLSLYDKLRQEGTVVTPLEKTLRGKQNGFVTDKYGVTWGLMYTNA